MYVLLTQSSGNGDSEYASPQLSPEQAGADGAILAEAIGTEGTVAKLSWGAFRGERIVSYRIVDALPVVETPAVPAAPVAVAAGA